MLGESLELSVSFNPERKGKKRQESSITSWSDKGQRRKILSEEDYVSGLTDIVIRDFYPAIPSLRRDIAVLDCRSTGDVSGAVAVRRAAREQEQQHVVTTTTLAEFHQQMTSEDNAEYERIQAEELKEHKQQTEQQYRCVKHRTIKPVDEESALASDLFTISLPKTTLDTSEKFQNDFFFYPENRNEPPRQQQQQQQHLLEGRNSQQDNNNLLMPPPPHRSTSDVASELSSVHVINTKVIQYSQTRFPYQNSSRLPPANSNNINFEIPNRKICNTEDTDDTDLDATPMSLTRARAERAQMKANELNTFIPMTPLIAPTRGTPVVGLPVFSLKKENSRERLVPIATSMVTKSKSKKQHVPPLLVSAAANLTPAAIQLLQKKTNNSILLNKQQPARMGSALRSALRSSYTPVVARLNTNPSSTSSRRGAAVATPRSERSGDMERKTCIRKKGNITDGLLLL
eukprot:CAMPEP_0172421070 /NCGR_PEP_ID=MMETSP1064-20121228/7353_1 /TAXON_ID=202472 /ORGANISM="Aulacoseira subarctica , Strain CCAP 1002/5" /LENGTH=458 /DNA_ID=CAMNT_0013161287 /DNA_START=56 /DNA_END=1432 /DNA_ORIENTATION=-